MATVAGVWLRIDLIHRWLTPSLALCRHLAIRANSAEVPARIFRRQECVCFIKTRRLNRLRSCFEAWKPFSLRLSVIGYGSKWSIISLEWEEKTFRLGEEIRRLVSSWDWMHECIFATVLENIGDFTATVVVCRPSAVISQKALGGLYVHMNSRWQGNHAVRVTRLRRSWASRAM